MDKAFIGMRSICGKMFGVAPDPPLGHDGFRATEGLAWLSPLNNDLSQRSTLRSAPGLPCPATEIPSASNDPTRPALLVLGAADWALLRDSCSACRSNAIC